MAETRNTNCSAGIKVFRNPEAGKVKEGVVDGEPMLMAPEVFLKHALVAENQLLKELDGTFGVVVEHHVILEINIGRCIGTDLDAGVIRMTADLEV